MAMKTNSFYFLYLYLIYFNFNVFSLPNFMDKQQMAKVNEYLHKYLYMDSTMDVDKENRMKLALRNFQKDVGLQSSGLLDENTLNLMKKKRCGTIQKLSNFNQRKRRFVPHRLIWPKTYLTWKLEDPTDMLGTYGTYMVKNTLHRAFGEWSYASRRALKFEEIISKNEKPDFIVLFANGSHNDSMPFDGPGGVVAHGFYPRDGNLHFDASEKWTLNMDEGVNLYQTAVHEIGHLLGLEHSADYSSVMYPLNRPYDPFYKLGDDDIRGIRYLYAPWTWSLCKTSFLKCKNMPKIDSYTSYNK